MIKGIDLSSHNGNVDMKKIKNEGIQFVILRIGYGKKQIDKKFTTNYKNAIENNISIGIYLYSYATNTEDAEKEAQLVLNNIKNLKIEYPIYIDMEDSDNYKKKHNVSYATCVDICEVFCETIENAGYYAGIYASLDWLNNKINDSKLDKFDKWVAQWGPECSYKKQYGMWQYSGTGKLNGISRNVDMNYAIYDYPQIIKKAKLNHLKEQNNNIYYTVIEGDTLSTIAQKFDITLRELYAQNKSIIGDNPNLIQIGQTLIIKEE